MNLNVTIFGQIISFVIFVWFCMKYVWIPLVSIIEKRQKEISDTLINAKNVKIESDRINSEALMCLADAKIKAQEIINYANSCKIQMMNKAKFEAEKEGNRILEQTRKQIIYERNQMTEELRRKISQYIIEATEKIIEHSLNENINLNIVNKMIEKLSNED